MLERADQARQREALIGCLEIEAADADDMDFLHRSLRLTLDSIWKQLAGDRLMLGLDSLTADARAVLTAEMVGYERLDALAVAALDTLDVGKLLKRLMALIESILELRGTVISGTAH